MRCLNCHKEPATIHSLYGIMAGKKCLARMGKIAKLKVSIEVTTSEIKEDRKKFSKDLTQPFRQGELSKEYVEAYPDRVKEMVKEGHVTQKEIVSAKNIWDLNYYKDE